MKKEICLLLLCALVVFSISRQAGKEADALRSQVRELSLRLAKVDETPEVRYIHDTVPVYETRVLEVDKTDYKRQLADRELIRELELKVSEIEAENRQLLAASDTTRLSLDGDSLYSYHDNWVDFIFSVSSGVLDWEVRDSLTTFVTAEYRHRFLWWKWGKKGYKVTIVNHNPRSEIRYNKYISVCR